MKYWSEISLQVKIFVLVICALAGVYQVFGWVVLIYDSTRYIFLVAIIWIFAFFSSILKIETYKGTSVTLDGMFSISSYMLLPWSFASIPVFFSTFLSDYIFHKKELYKCMFNASNYALSIAVSAYFVQRYSPLGYPKNLEHFIIVFLGGFIFLTVNGSLVSAVIALDEKYHMLDIMTSILHFEKRLIFSTFAEVTGSILFAYAILEKNVFVFFSLISILALLGVAIKREAQVRGTIRAAIVSLVETIGTRDEYTKGHCMRVAEMAKLTAKEMKLSFLDVELAEFAGMLHDIGKINFPDDLFSAKHLDPEAWNVIKSHPETGKKILEGMPEFRRIQDIIELHHERIDGTGYPNGMKNGEIPLTSKILAVCDAYDAMTSNRIYRKPFPPEIAINEILAFRGKSFEPRVVDAFLRVVKRYYDVKLEPTPKERRKR